MSISNGLLGGCQNYGPFLVPYYNTAPTVIFRVPKKVNATRCPVRMRTFLLAALQLPQSVGF